ncbi:MAG: DUF2155 domain-containing protein [Alphaproteobacteria bacterium]|nr:DUF2155 domain-containing protein [Alphaproteobacteria bacterium]
MQKLIRAVGCCATLLLCLLTVESAAIEGKAVVLQGLDKVTARVSKFEAAIGDTVRFGSLQIVPRACDRTPPEEPPESTVYLDITDLRPGGAPVDLFHGWMFASSPALNALEHPVYDVWVLECKVLVGDDVKQQ